MRDEEPTRDDTEPLPEAVGGPAPPERTSGFRWVAIVVVAVVALAVGLLVANVVVARAAAERAGERAVEAVGAPVHVSFSGFPVGLRLLTGQPVDMRLAARDVPLPGADVTLDRLEVTLDGVPIDFARLDAEPLELRAERGEFVAELDDAAVQQLIGIIGRIPLADIELRSGVARLNFAGFPIVDASADIEGGMVVFRPTAPLGSLVNVQLRLEELPFGLQADEVEIRRGALRLSGSVRNVRLTGVRDEAVVAAPVHW